MFLNACLRERENQLYYVPSSKPSRLAILPSHAGHQQLNPFWMNYGGPAAAGTRCSQYYMNHENISAYSEIMRQTMDGFFQGGNTGRGRIMINGPEQIIWASDKTTLLNFPRGFR